MGTGLKRFVSCIVALLTLTGLFWLFPLFHIIPLKRAREAKAAATFDPRTFADQFWTNQLLKSLDRAVDADTLLAAIRANPANARKTHARSLGLSDSYTYFVSGKGEILSVSDDEIEVVVREGAREPDVALQVGLLFSSAIRDGTGLLNVNDYPNSQEFNGISEALNQIIETRVLPRLRETAKVGATVLFAGCAEVNDDATDLTPLKVIPIQAEVK